jgi:pimeloyl-ACP methyl ester carboxylesterase
VAGFDYAGWIDRYDGEIRAGRIDAALVTVIRGTRSVRAFELLPRVWIEAFVRLAMRRDEQHLRPGDVPIRTLVPTMHYDARVVREAAAAFARLADLRCELLLVGGSKSAAFMGPPMDALAKMHPRARRVEIRGEGHVAADNHGAPAKVAAILRAFFRA